MKTYMVLKQKFLLYSIICITAIIWGSSIHSRSMVKQAPGFAIFDIEDKFVSLNDLTKKHNLIISFWASYCLPCKKEIPQLVELEKKYSLEKNLKLVLINIDTEGKVKAKPVLDELGVSTLCLMDIYQINTKNYISNLKIPAVFIVNRENEIVFEAVGENEENLQKLEKAIINLK